MARTATSIGVCVAPEFQDDTLDKYASLIATCDNAEIKEKLEQLLVMASAWYVLPESKKGETKEHPSGRVTVQMLDDEIKTHLEASIPWTRDIASMGELFDSISPATHKPLRDAAYHLLWLARELDLDREPCTLNKLKPQE